MKLGLTDMSRAGRRLGCLLLTVLFLLTLPGEGPLHAREFSPLPEAFDIRVRTVYTFDRHHVWIDRVTTGQASVDAALADAIALLEQQARPLLTSRSRQLEITASWRGSGTSLVSFLLISRVTVKRETQWMDFRCLTFDLDTGEQLQLSDLFGRDSPAYEVIGQAVRQSLSRMYPQEDKPAHALDALGAHGQAAGLPFMVGTYQLSFPVALWQLLPERYQLSQAVVYYDQLLPYVRADMAAQLDNTAYKVLALTFDDGPVGGYTRNAVKTLGHHGAVGTFFVIGTCVRASPEGARRAADAGNPLGGHSMYHKYGYQIKAEMVPEDHALFVQTLQRHTGLSPDLFRAPGGDYEKYIRNGVDLPHIRWSIIGDPETTTRPSAIAAQVLHNAGHRDIVLLHDNMKITVESLEEMLAGLRKRGFRLATVEEMFRMQGIALEKGVSYNSAKPGQSAQ